MSWWASKQNVGWQSGLEWLDTAFAVMTTKAAVVLISEGGKPMLECFSPQFNHWTSIKPRKTLENGGREVFFLSRVITKKGPCGNDKWVVTRIGCGWECHKIGKNVKPEFKILLIFLNWKWVYHGPNLLIYVRLNSQVVRLKEKMTRNPVVSSSLDVIGIISIRISSIGISIDTLICIVLLSA